jgi:uncharacterized protein
MTGTGHRLDAVVAELPLFPLGTVLFPGLVMPLRIFEDRYHSLVRHLLTLPEEPPREFGVVAIRRGWEVDGSPGSAPVRLHDIGCTAQLRTVTERDDGQLDIVTVGRRRFEIMRMLPADTPYLRAEVRYLPDQTDGADDGAADRLCPRVLAVFRKYLHLVRTGPDERAELAEQLPDDPTVLSYLVAATAGLTLTDRQRLLAAPDPASRLRAELSLLGWEVALLGQVRAVPVTVAELPVRPGPN